MGDKCVLKLDTLLLVEFFDLDYLNLLVNVVAYVNTLNVFPVFSAKFLLSQSITSK